LDQRGATMRVLIAEDETVIRLDLRAQLEEEGVVVCGEARDGEEAVALARSLKPDAALLDIRMPILDGIEATRRIHEETPLPVVLLSGHSDTKLVDEAIAAGVSGYLVKPFHSRELMPALRTAVARHGELVAARTPAATTVGSTGPRSRREEIFQQAARIFCDKGFATATMQEIAEAVGLLKGSLYYYFDAKEALLIEIVGEAHREAWQCAVAAADSEDVIGDFVGRYLGWAATRRHEAVLLLEQQPGLPAETRDALETFRSAYVGFLADAVRSGQAAGTMRAELDANLAAESLLGFLAAASRSSALGHRGQPAVLSGMVAAGLAA
jgi:two-component system, response regulator PdtaR